MPGTGYAIVRRQVVRKRIEAASPSSGAWRAAHGPRPSEQWCHTSKQQRNAPLGCYGVLERRSVHVRSSTFRYGKRDGHGDDGGHFARGRCDRGSSLHVLQRSSPSGPRSCAITTGEFHQYQCESAGTTAQRRCEGESTSSAQHSVDSEETFRSWTTAAESTLRGGPGSELENPQIGAQWCLGV